MQLHEAVRGYVLGLPKVGPLRLGIWPTHGGSVEALECLAAYVRPNKWVSVPHKHVPTRMLGAQH